MAKSQNCQSNDKAVCQSEQKRWPKLVILLNQVLFLLICSVFGLGVFRLILHLFLPSVQVPQLLLASIFIVPSLIFCWSSSTLETKVVFEIVAALLLIPVLVTYESFWPLYERFSAWCLKYANDQALSSIFMSMGVINFSFSYVVSAREKRFYGVLLGNVIQEQFPTYGFVFVIYTCLALMGLYSSNMNYAVVAFLCLCGALLAFGSTCIMAVLFTFRHRLKQDMVEYYLYGNPQQLLFNGRSIPTDTSPNRMLAAADYIRAYYVENGIIPSIIAKNLWGQLFAHETQSFSPDSSAVVKPDDSVPDGGEINDISSYIQLVACAASSWRHMLQGLSSEQQSELVCLVLQDSLDKNDELINECKQFLDEHDNRSTPNISPYRALPLCGLVSYLRSKCTIVLDSPVKYWKDCLECLRIFYRVYLLYPGIALRTKNTQTLTTIPQFMFLLLETTMLVEMSALEQEKFVDDTDFWNQLLEVEHALRIRYRDCSWFSEWGLSIVCSYKIDWFQSHQGMLEAYLTYQRLFDLLDEHDDAESNTESSSTRKESF